LKIQNLKVLQPIVLIQSLTQISGLLKPKNLLNQLAELENALQNFSFEELSAENATRLKTSFDTFRQQLEGRIFGEDLGSEPTPSPEILQATPALSENREAKLIATVSHEIRTPLSGIVGFADLLGESKLNEEQQDQINAIRAASANLMDIINELLEYSKILAGLEHFETLPFNFNDLIKETVYLCQSLKRDKGIGFELKQDPLIPDVLIGDPAKLSQILLNLIGNSMKFVEEGGITLNISLIKEREGQVWIEFVVSDTGIGISEEDLQHIFDSFRQANQQIFSRYGGTGLGLNIVKQIIDKLGGELEVSSRLGVGTTFRFTVPYATGSAIKSPKNTKVELSPEMVAGMRVLVFEDNLLSQRLIEKRLNSWEVVTDITENAYYGLEVLEKNQIDLVLMDLRMPDMNGFEVTQLIRNHQQKSLREVPIVALTADFTIEDKEACEDQGIDDYLLKPYSPENLLAMLVRYKKSNTSSKRLNTIEDKNSVDTDPQEALLDLKPALEDCMGDIDMLHELIVFYKQNALEFIGKVKVYLRQEDFGMIRDAAHKIKCGLAMMHTHKLHGIVEQIHENCKTTQDTAELEGLYLQFVQEYSGVEKELDIEFEKLESKS
jgi:signal transduction histidine kinase/DNA-binding NarL/FixJ family response regulator/HPt (histidine-containing phosphotransfer) domain-containing protein